MKTINKEDINIIDDDDISIKGKGHGKKPNQKLKPYLVMDYLMRRSDESHTVSADNIVAYLMECGIYAERRSIYSDIEAINKTLLIIEEGMTAEEAEKAIKEDESQKMVLYDKHSKGFFVRQRRYDLNDIRLLAECIYSAKFLAEGQTKRLVDVVCEFVSEEQAKTIKYDALLTDRVKTNNRSVIMNIATINEAMSRELEGQRHTPEKISFKYLKSTINDISKQIERRKGSRYVVSPFKLLINDGNYYLLAFDDSSHQMRTYRVDRMKGVERIGEPREGDEIFWKIDLKNYTNRVFSMYGGRTEPVKLRFPNHLLDTAIERFGTSGASYTKVDDTHFIVEANVEISDQFFGWLLGFGKRVKLLEPLSIVDKFTEYLDKIRKMY